MANLFTLIQYKNSKLQKLTLEFFFLPKNQETSLNDAKANLRKKVDIFFLFIKT
jgi:hypothetical protein